MIRFPVHGMMQVDGLIFYSLLNMGLTNLGLLLPGKKNGKKHNK